MGTLSAEELIAAGHVPIAGFVLALGLLVGSFLNVVIARVPVGLSVVKPRSRCPHCEHMIPSWLNIPVLSWLVLRGKCAKCKAPISIRYPVVELLTGVLFLACFRQLGFNWALLLGMILCATLMAITWIDIDTFEIPDEISIPGIAVGILLRPIAFDVPWYSGLVAAILAAVAILGLRWGFAAVRGIEGMGLGDVKLLAMIGAFLGAKLLLPVLLVASLSGLVVGIPLVLRQRWQARNDPEPEAEADIEVEPPAPDERPVKIRLTAMLQVNRRTWRLGGKDVGGGRTHVRAAWVWGMRGRNGPGMRLTIGLINDEAGWGLFDGFSYGLGKPGFKLWFGPMVGLNELYEEDGEDAWVPPENAVPFGPFLALGALFSLFYGHLFLRWLTFANI